jgi:hypothetical protein
LIQQGAHEGRVALAVRVPDAGQTGEARRRQYFVDGSVVLDPGVAPGYRAGVLGELFGEGRIDQARMFRAAAMMDQSDDGGDAEALQRGQAGVGPGPVGAVDAIRSSALPQYRITDRLDPERGEALDVFHAVGVAIAFHLAEVIVAYTVDRAFKAAPKRQLGCGLWLDLLVDVHEKYLVVMRQAPA